MSALTSLVHDIRDCLQLKTSHGGSCPKFATNGIDIPFRPKAESHDVDGKLPGLEGGIGC